MIAEITNATNGLPAPSSAAAIGWLIISITALLVSINAAFTLKKNIFPSKNTTEISPQPISVQLVEHFVRKEECMGRHNESTGRIQTLQEQMEALRVERRADTDQLHDKVNTVAREVSGLKTATELQNQQLARMDTKLDRIVEKRLGQL